jgi:hypothetical protein
LPVKTIFYEVAGDKLLKIGADRKTKADEEAKGTQTGGGSNRAGSGGEKPYGKCPKTSLRQKKRGSDEAEINQINLSQVSLIIKLFN